MELFEKRSYLNAISWDGGGDGSHWSDANNWNTNALPLSGDDVTINVALSPTVVIDGAVTVHSLNTGELLKINGSTASLKATTMSFSQNVTLDNWGTLYDTSATGSGSAKLVVVSGTLSNDVITVGTLDVSNGTVYVENNLTINGIWQMGSLTTSTWGYAYLHNGAQTISGTGTILLNNGYLYNESTGVTTLGAGLTIRGKNGWVQSALGGGTLQANGSVSSDLSGGQIEIYPGFQCAGNLSASNSSRLTLHDFTNLAGSTISAATAGTVSMQGDWSSLGTISLNAGTLELGGSFTQAGMGAFNRVGGTVSLTGTVSGNLGLTAATGSWVMNWGTIQNGTLSEAGGAKLLVNYGTLRNVTIANDLDLSTGTLYINDGITLNAMMTMGDLVNNTWGTIYANGVSLDSTQPTQTVGGTGTILANHGSINNYMSGAIDDMTGEPFYATLAFGANLTIHGKDLNLYNSADSSYISNLGTVSADVSGGRFDFGTRFSNSGVLRAINGSTLALTDFANAAGVTLPVLNSTLTMRGNWSNAGVIDVNNSMFQMQGSFTQAGMGTVNRTGGTMSLEGVITGGLLLNATTGDWVANWGTIKDGIFTTADGNTLNVNYCTFDNVSLNTDLKVGNGTLYVYNGLSVNGLLTLGDLVANTWATLYFHGDHTSGQALTGSGEILSNNASFSNYMTGPIDPGDGSTLPAVLGMAVYIHGKNLTTSNWYNEDSMWNQGRIAADVDGGRFDFGPHFRSTGQLQAYNGSTLLLTDFTNEVGETLEPMAATLVMRGQWHNLGTMTLDQSRLQLQGEFTQADLGAFGRTAGSTVSLEGVLSGGLALDSTTGTWEANYGTLKDGTFSTTNEVGHPVLQVYDMTLDNMTLASDLTLNNATVRVYNNLVVNSTLGLTGTMYFYGDRVAGQSVSGSGLIQVDYGSINNYMVGPTDVGTGQTLSSTLTIAANVTINATNGGGNGLYVWNGNSYDFVKLAGTVNVQNGMVYLYTQSSVTGTLNVQPGASFTQDDSLNLSQMQDLNAPFGSTLNLSKGWNGRLPVQGSILNHAAVRIANTSGQQFMETWAPDLGAATPHANTVLQDLTLDWNTTTRLLDLFDNEAGTGNEAIYVATLTLQPGSTLDLNGLHLYARNVVNNGGTVMNGTVTQSPDQNPTSLALSNNITAENTSAVVGHLSATDPDVASTFTYSLVSGAGSDNNGQFWISGNDLTFSWGNYEAQPDLSVRIRVTDEGGAYFEQPFTVHLTDVNEAPYYLQLSSSDVVVNSPAGWAVGNLSAEDYDAGDVLTYSLVAGDGSSGNAEFTIVGNTLQMANPVALPIGSGYSIRVRATDAGGLYTEQVYNLTVVELQSPPTDIQLSANTIAENDWEPLIGTFSATDPNAGDWASFSLPSGQQDNHSFFISGNQLYPYGYFNYEGKSQYNIVVRATDSTGLTFDKSFTINVTDVNEQPTGLSFSFQGGSINETNPAGTEVGAFAATDPDTGDTLTYSLVSGAGDNDNGSFTIAGNKLVIASQLNYEQATSASFRVRVTDAAGLSYEDSFWFSISDDNSAPTALALDTAAIAENLPANSMVGTLSATDIDPTEQFFGQLVTNANGGVDSSYFWIDQNHLMTAQPLDFESKSSYDIRVRVEETNTGLWYEQNFVITATDQPEAPTSISLSNNQVPEKQPVQTWVGDLSASDPDAGSTFTYSLVAGPGDTDNAQFGISPGELVTTASFDTTVRSVYSIRVRATDSTGLFTEEVFAITVTAVNSAPTDITLTNTSIDENTPAGALIGVFGTVDPDAGNTFTYSLVAGVGSTDNASFTVGASDLMPAASFNYEAKTSYSIRVRSTDQGGQYTEKVFIINVNNVNEAPVITVSPITLSENQPIDTIVGTVTVSDPDAGDHADVSFAPGMGSDDLFTIDASGNIRTAIVFDYEALSGGTLVFNATDLLGLGSQKVVNFAVTDVNEAPTGISPLNAFFLQDGMPASSPVAYFTTADPDGGFHIYSLVSGIGDTDNASFQIMGDSLQTAAVLHYATKSSYSIRLRSADADGLFVDEVFTINMTPPPGNAPTDITLSNSSGAENGPANAVVGTLSSQDADAAETFTYTLVGGTGSADNASFQIVGNQLQATSSFNFEAKNSYSIRVRTTDSAGLTFEKAFTISVSNVNETPSDLALSSTSVDENEAAGTVVGTLSSTDADAAESFTYSLVSGTGSGGNGLFTIAGNQLKTSAIFNYETKTYYNIRVRSTDAGGAYVEKSITINVANLNEAPTDITLTGGSVTAGLPAGTIVGTLAGSDPDAGETFTYSLEPGTGATDNGSFQIVGNQVQTASVLAYKSSYSVRVRVTDDGGLYFEKVLAITGAPGANASPTGIAVSNASIDENEPAGTVVGILSATDSDAGETLTYSLVSGTGSGGNGLFQIVGNELQTRSGFDYEVKTYYNIRVRVTDHAGAFYEKSIKINVVDLVEPLVINGTSGNDLIDLSVDGAFLVVGVNGVETNYSLAMLDGITINCLGGNDTLLVGTGVPMFVANGGDGDDSLYGGDGNDTLFGGTGNDILYGGLGHDALRGEDGNDTLYGDAGDDRMYGDKGYDFLDGGDGSDRLDGGTGNDTLYGGRNQDVLTGAAGADLLYGQDGKDTLLGGDQNDTLDGGNGWDVMDGGAGNDLFFAIDTSAYSDTLTGGGGTDVAHVDALSDVVSGMASTYYV